MRLPTKELEQIEKNVRAWERLFTPEPSDGIPYMTFILPEDAIERSKQ